MEIEYRRKPEIITRFSRDMRKDMTHAEKILRSQLKAKQLQGWKIHRQKPLFIYKEETGKDRWVIADFYHHPSKVVIEVDGGIHDLPEIASRDAKRTRLLEHRGFVVVRYTNDQVIHELETVIKDIEKTISDRLETISSEKLGPIE